MYIDVMDGAGMELTMPAWIFGSYLIRDFARNIVTIHATQGGQTVTLEKIDKQRWHCLPSVGVLAVEYDVYAFDLSVRGAYFDNTRAYFNGTSLFLRVVGRENEPHRVTIAEGFPGWRVATTLPSDRIDAAGFGDYSAEGYYALVDHPIEISDHQTVLFEVSGTPHAIAITGRQNGDAVRLTNDLRKICEAQVALFGSLPSMERYLFQIMAVGDGYGGLEHSTSCSLLCSRNDLPYAGMEDSDEGYIKLLGLCSHEYFHLWNVKRIQPERFRLADLTSEAYSTLLWAFEGITSYYDDLVLVRSGLIDTQTYLGLLAQTITRATRGSGRLKQTLAESSFDAWTKFYKQDENSPNAIVSYYAKGAVVALALDLTIRQQTEERFSLDDVMRHLWERYGRTGIGVPEEGVEQAAAEVTGLNLKRFFDDAIRGTGNIALESLLETVGVGIRYRPSQGDKDLGGCPAKKSSPMVPVLGAKLVEAGSELKLAAVYDDGAAQAAGLAAGDQIIAIEGLRATRSNLNRLLASVSPTAPLTFLAFRRDELMTFQVTPRHPPADTCDLWPLESTTRRQSEQMRHWLHLPTPELSE